MDIEIASRLGDMLPGTLGRVVGYEQAYRGYIGRLTSLSLVPGAEFMTIWSDSDTGLVEIFVQGAGVRLRKQEANALIVEEVDNNLN
ncbi:MAG: FeoA family protein [Cyanobacteriota bacterium]|nr:FeoA family protein [Cyanobacteriota bacterium]